jgi:ribosomal protein L14
MFDRGTEISITDNSGISKVSLLQLYRHHQWPKSGDIILGVLKIHKRLKKHIKKKIYPFILLRTKQKFLRRNGFYYCQFPFLTAVGVENDRNTFLGTKIRTPLSLEMRKRLEGLLFKHNRIYI